MKEENTQETDKLYSIEDLFKAWAYGFEYAEESPDRKVKGRWLVSKSLKRRFYDHLELITK